jgi:hypothetical protein
LSERTRRQEDDKAEEKASPAGKYGSGVDG